MTLIGENYDCDVCGKDVQYTSTPIIVKYHFHLSSVLHSRTALKITNVYVYVCIEDTLYRYMWPM